jgi:hypothetical protein
MFKKFLKNRKKDEDYFVYLKEKLLCEETCSRMLSLPSTPE